MKLLIAAITMSACMSAFADPVVISGTVVGDLEQIFTTQELSESATESLVEMSEEDHMKAIAVVIENDSQNYFQNGEMSVFLSSTVKKLKAMNSDLSDDDAISALLDFASIHDK